MSIFVNAAKTQVIRELQGLAPDDLNTLIEATSGALTPDEAKQHGIIARLTSGRYFDLTDIAQLYYYTLRELPTHAELLRAEIAMQQILRDETKEMILAKCQQHKSVRKLKPTLTLKRQNHWKGATIRHRIAN